MTITTFSSTHEFRPTCLMAAIARDGADPNHTESIAVIAAMITSRIDRGWCPRCEQGKLPDGNPVKPAGSRTTDCRCIPVCGPCGTDEGRGTEYLTGPLWWPVDGVHERYAADVAAAQVAVWDASGVLLTDVSIITPVPRQHPGSWAEYGHDGEAGPR